MTMPAPLSAAQLHEPILPLARPAPVVLKPDMTIQDAMTLIRTSSLPSSIHYFYVVDDEQPAGRRGADAPDTERRA